MKILIPLLYDSYNEPSAEELVIEPIVDRVQIQLEERIVQVSRAEFLQVCKMLKEEE